MNQEIEKLKSRTAETEERLLRLIGKRFSEGRADLVKKSLDETDAMMFESHPHPFEDLEQREYARMKVRLAGVLAWTDSLTT